VYEETELTLKQAA